MSKYSFFIMLLLCCCFQLKAQQVSQKVLRSKWVKIMANDSSYNFLEAQKEFQSFYTAFLKEERKQVKIYVFFRKTPWSIIVQFRTQINFNYLIPCNYILQVKIVSLIKFLLMIFSHSRKRLQSFLF